MQATVLEIGDAPGAVYSQLRDMILSGALRAGEPVKIQAVADQMGISIVPVREAIRMLAAEELLELRPRRSPIVGRLELPQILEINNIRLALEPYLLELAIAGHNSASIKKCQSLIEADQAADSYRLKVDLNRQFHLALLNPSEQPRALKIVEEQFLSIARFAQIMVLRGSTELRGHLHHEHTGILEAVKAKDTQRAVELMKQHISSAARRIELQLDGASDSEAVPQGRVSSP